MEQKIAKTIDWEYALKKPGKECCVSGRSFEPGDDYVSFIRYDEEEGWGRADISPECFEELDPKPFAYWRAKVQKPEAKKTRPLDLNFLTEFFVCLQEQKDQEEHAEVGYIVTLLLVRKKVLTQLGLSVEDDKELLEVRFNQRKRRPGSQGCCSRDHRRKNGDHSRRLRPHLQSRRRDEGKERRPRRIGRIRSDDGRRGRALEARPQESHVDQAANSIRARRFLFLVDDPDKSGHRR